MKTSYQLIFYVVGLVSTTIVFGENVSLTAQKIHATGKASTVIENTSDQRFSEQTSHALFTDMISTEFEKLSSAQQQNIATRWGLSASEYAQYLQLMEGSPDGFYYRDQHLDPTWILGMNAKSEAERKKYVTLAVLHERERMAKLLLFQQTFDRLQRDLFPQDKPIQFSNQEQTLGAPITCRQNY